MLRSTRTMLCLHVWSKKSSLVQQQHDHIITRRHARHVERSRLPILVLLHMTPNSSTPQPDSHLSAATEHTIGNGPVPHCSCTSNKIRVLAAPTREHRRTKIRLYTRTDERENFCDIFPRRFTHTTQRRKRALLYGEPPVIHTHKSL